MRKILCLLVLMMGCDDTPPKIELTPPFTPTPIATPEAEDAMTVLLKEVAVHEFGHALGLLHPFDSLLPESEDCKIKLRANGIEDSGIAELVKEYYPDYYNVWDTLYDSSSIMNYGICRSVKGYKPSMMDLLEAAVLLQAFKDIPMAPTETMALTAPILPETINIFRRSEDIPVCINEVVTESQKEVIKVLVNTASEEWKPAGWNIHFEDTCSNSENEVRIGVMPMPKESGLYVAGYSYLGLVGGKEVINMRLMVP